MGTQKFARLRVGIGEPSRDAIGHVLSRFAPDERKTVDEVLDAAADAVEDWAREGATRGRPTAGTPGRCVSPAAEPAGPPAPQRTDGAPAGARRPPAAGADGIVRTKTGWRKLLRRG